MAWYNSVKTWGIVAATGAALWIGGSLLKENPTNLDYIVIDSILPIEEKEDTLRAIVQNAIQRGSVTKDKARFAYDLLDSDGDGKLTPKQAAIYAHTLNRSIKEIYRIAKTLEEQQ
jgi:hypothetical protein